MFTKFSFKVAIVICTSVLAMPNVAYAIDTERLISLSDDLDRYRKVFAEAANNLLEDGTCKEAEFIENGGWIRSTAFKPRAVYFMYCGGTTVDDRLYLDVNTGKIFR